MPSCQLEALRPAHQFAAKNCGARASHVYKSRQSFFCSVGQFQLFTGFQVSNVVHTNEKMKSPNYSTVRTTAGDGTSTAEWEYCTAEPKKKEISGLSY